MIKRDNWTAYMLENAGSVQICFCISVVTLQKTVVGDQDLLLLTVIINTDKSGENAIYIDRNSQ